MKTTHNHDLDFEGRWRSLKVTPKVVPHLKIIYEVWRYSVENFMLLSQNAQFFQYYGLNCCTTGRPAHLASLLLSPHITMVAVSMETSCCFGKITASVKKRRQGKSILLLSIYDISLGIRRHWELMDKRMIILLSLTLPDSTWHPVVLYSACLGRLIFHYGVFPCLRPRLWLDQWRMTRMFRVQ